MRKVGPGPLTTAYATELAQPPGPDPLDARRSKQPRPGHHEGPGRGSHRVAVRATRTAARSARSAAPPGAPAGSPPACRPRSRRPRTPPASRPAPRRPTPVLRQSAVVTSAARNRPTTMPRTAPISAVMMLSCRTIRRTWRRVMPTARSMPSSRVRSNTDSTSVLTMPNRLHDHRQRQQHVEDRRSWLTQALWSFSNPACVWTFASGNALSARSRTGWLSARPSVVDEREAVLAAWRRLPSNVPAEIVTVAEAERVELASGLTMPRTSAAACRPEAGVSDEPARPTFRWCLAANLLVTTAPSRAQAGERGVRAVLPVEPQDRADRASRVDPVDVDLGAERPRLVGGDAEVATCTPGTAGQRARGGRLDRATSRPGRSRT